MGTNYYWIKNPCPTCGHGETLHIGKASCGWAFNFQAHIDIRSYNDWLKIFEEEKGIIQDEYSQIISVEEFKNIVELKRKESKNYADLYPEDSYKDEDGNSFSEYNFS